MTEEQFLDIVKDEHQLTVAHAYAQLIKSEQEVDWTKINHAIVDRWSKTALLGIKKIAWQLMGEK